MNLFYSLSKLHELEANLCKIQSRYFILLKESQEPALGGWACQGVWLGGVASVMVCVCVCVFRWWSHDNKAGAGVSDAPGGAGGGGRRGRKQLSQQVSVCVCVCVCGVIAPIPPCSSYDGYGFSQRWVGTEKELVTNPLEAKARKLDTQARTAQTVIDVSLQCHHAFAST